MLTACGLAAPAAPNTSTPICTSCNNLVNFSRKLVDNNGYEELRANLIKWCVDAGRGNVKICSFLIKDTLTAIDRIASEYFCQRIKVRDSSHPAAAS